MSDAKNLVVLPRVEKQIEEPKAIPLFCRLGFHSYGKWKTLDRPGSIHVWQERSCVHCNLTYQKLR